MRITKEAYHKLINCPQVPPEIGGILIGANSTIDTIVFDAGMQNATDSTIEYIPNVAFLNDCISILCKQKNEFLGIFHTHASQWDSLSNADMYYIKKIMDAMPPEIEFLYFPIVYPKKDIKVYKALRNPKEHSISAEDIELV